MLNDSSSLCILRDMLSFPRAKLLLNFVATIDLTVSDFTVVALE